MLSVHRISYGVAFTDKFKYWHHYDITAQVAKDGREHIEYVPTQVVSEYIRHVLKAEGKSIDGVVYQSSKDGGTEACVLFFENSACVDSVSGERSEALLLHKVSRQDFRKETHNV